MDSVISFVRRIIPPTETDFYVPATWIYDGAAVDLDFVNNRYWSDPAFVASTDLLSISRASVGTAKTATGTITQFASNTLRITSLGLLVEDTRDNKVFPSVPDDGLGGTAWAAVSTTSTPNNALAPDGTTTAAKLQDTVANSVHQFFNNTGSSYSSGVQIAVSIFMKNGTRRYAFLSTYEAFTDNQAYVGVDLLNGSVTANGVTGGAWTLNSYGIEAYGDGWYRVWLVATATGAIASVRNQIDLSNDGTSFLSPYLGDGSYIYLWGGQIETAAPFISSYIPTTTAAATRAADAITLAGRFETVRANLPQTILINVKTIAAAIGNWGFLCDSAAADFNQLAIDNSGSSQTSMFATDDSSHNLNAFNVVSTWAAGNKIGESQQSGGRTLVGGGGPIYTDGFGSARSGNILGSNHFVTGYYVFGYFRRITGWSSRLADATLRVLTVP